jgi:hypothetical protein
MKRIPIAGAVLLVLLGAALLIRVTDRADVPPTNPVSVPREIRTNQAQPVTDSVDLNNGNLHVQVPVVGGWPHSIWGGTRGQTGERGDRQGNAGTDRGTRGQTGRFSAAVGWPTQSGWPTFAPW